MNSSIYLGFSYFVALTFVSFDMSLPDVAFQLTDTWIIVLVLFLWIEHIKARSFLCN